MDYEQIKNHFKYVNDLHAITTTLKMVTLFLDDINNVHFSKDYYGRLHFEHADLDQTLSFHRQSDVSTGTPVTKDNYVLRNTWNALCIRPDYFFYDSNVSFEFPDIRNEIIAVCNKIFDKFEEQK